MDRATVEASGKMNIPAYSTSDRGNKRGNLTPYKSGYVLDKGLDDAMWASPLRQMKGFSDAGAARALKPLYRQG